MHPALAAWLTDTVTLERYQSQNAYGASVYAAPQSVPARIEYTTVHMANRQGQDIVSTTLVFLDADVTVDHRDRLTLSDGTHPSIQRIMPVKDHQGVLQHWELSL